MSLEPKPSEQPPPPRPSSGSLGRGAASLDEELASRSSSVFLSVLDVFKVGSCTRMLFNRQKDPAIILCFAHIDSLLSELSIHCSML